MTTTVRGREDITSHVPGHVDHEHGVDVLDGSEQDGHGHPHAHPLRKIWLFLISMRTGLWIILTLGVLTLLGTLLMQVEPEVRADAAAYQQWLAGTPTQRYGGWAGILDKLGLFHVFSTWYFMGLFALLSLSILACSINRAPRLWRVATKPRTTMSDVFYDHAPLRATVDLPADSAAATEQVRAALRARHFRIVDAHADNGTALYADRFRWGPFGTVIAHLSLIIVMLGFVVSASTGFRDKSFIAPVGVPVSVGHGTGLTVEAKSFTDSYYDNGAPKDYVSDLVLTQDGKQVARHETRVNSPMIYDGTWFHQSSFGNGADVTVKDGDTTVYSGLVPLQWQSDDGQQSIGQLTIPDRGISVYVVEAASGQVLADLPAGSAQLEVHKVGVNDPLGAPVVSQGQSAVVDGLTYTYERNRQYTALTVKQDSGSWVVGLGAALLILGCYLVFFMPHRRLWVRVRDNADGTSRVRLGAPLKRDPGFEPVFSDLVSTITRPDAPVGQTSKESQA